MAIVIEIPFSTDESSDLPSSGMIPFDPNIDMSSSCFVCSNAFVVLDDVPSGGVVTANVGAVQPIDINTQAFILRWNFSPDPTVDLILDFQRVMDVYLAKGFSGWSVSAPGSVTGRLLLFGDVVACSETIMALVTFDYSSLVSVSSGAVVRSRKTIAQTSEI